MTSVGALSRDDAASWSAPRLSAFLVRHAGNDAAVKRAVKKRSHDQRFLVKCLAHAQEQTPAQDFNVMRQAVLARGPKEIQGILTETGLPAVAFEGLPEDATMADMFRKALDYAASMVTGTTGSFKAGPIVDMLGSFVVRMYPIWEDDEASKTVLFGLRDMALPDIDAWRPYTDAPARVYPPCLSMAAVTHIERAWHFGCISTDQLVDEVLAPTVEAIASRAEAISQGADADPRSPDVPMSAIFGFQAAVTHAIHVLGVTMTDPARSRPSDPDPVPALQAEARATFMKRKLHAKLAFVVKTYAGIVQSWAPPLTPITPSPDHDVPKVPIHPGADAALALQLRDQLVAVLLLIPLGGAGARGRPADMSSPLRELFLADHDAVEHVLNAYYTLHAPGAARSRCEFCDLYTLVQFLTHGVRMGINHNPTEADYCFRYDAKEGMFFAPQRVHDTIGGDLNPHNVPHGAPGEGLFP